MFLWQHLVKKEIIITADKTNDAGRILGGGTDYFYTVSTLEIRLHHLVVFSIRKGERLEMWTLESESIKRG